MELNCSLLVLVFDIAASLQKVKNDTLFGKERQKDGTRKNDQRNSGIVTAIF
jgi:hypothetical protein